MTNKNSKILIILFYILITLIVTWPIALKPFSHIYSVYGDSLGTLWGLWWTAFALKQGVSVIDSPYFAAPFTERFFFSSADYLFSIPSTLIFGEVFTYNLFIWLSFILAGLGTYLLVYYLTKNKWAAFIAGVIYSFSPFHYVRAMGHWDLAQIQWIPFFLYFLVRFDQERRWRFFIYSLLFAGLTLITSPYYGIFLPVIAAVYILVSAALQRRWKDLGITFVIFIGIIIFTLAARLFISYPTRFPKELKVWGVDWWNYLIPSPDNPLIGGFGKDFFLANIGGSNVTEKTAYVGIIALILVFVGLVRGLLDKKYRPCVIAFTVVLAITFFATLGDNFITRSLNYLAPFFRAPNRLVIFVQLMISILAGYGLKHIFDRLNSKFEIRNSKSWLRVTGYGLLVLLILLETYNAQPNHIIPAQASTPAIDWVKNNLNKDDIILQMPMVNRASNQSPEIYYFQRLHQKKLANNLFNYAGQRNTIPKEYRDLWKNLNLNLLETLPRKETLETLERLGIHYIIMFTSISIKEVPYDLPNMKDNPHVELLAEFHKDKIIYGDLRDEWQEAEVYRIKSSVISN